MAGAKAKHGDPRKSYIRIGLLFEPLGEVRLAAASMHETDTYCAIQTQCLQSMDSFFQGEITQAPLPFQVSCLATRYF